MKILLIAGMGRIMGENAYFLKEYFEKYGYYVLLSEDHVEAWDYIRNNIITCIIIEATFALQIFNENKNFISSINQELPIVTIGNSRRIGSDWIRATYRAQTREYANVPFDVEGILAQVRKITGES